MGAANVIPGVSGGTVAFVTGIFETLINALKSFDINAIQMILKGRLKDLWQHINGNFLLPLGLGVVVSLVSLAKLLGYLLDHHPILIAAFFFGLILASVYFVGKTVGRWSVGPIVGLLVGAGVAAGIALLKPATENANLLYLVVCGMIAMCSMIIPGLSGSFVLLLLGNYRLVLGAVDDFTSAAGSFKMEDLWPPLKILVPVMIGVVAGMILFSHLISWIFKRFRDVAIAVLTGFVAGSLLVIWPWKHEITQTTASSKEIVEGYNWYLPQFTNGATWAAIGIIVVGVVLVAVMETLGAERES